MQFLHHIKNFIQIRNSKKCATESFFFTKWWVFYLPLEGSNFYILIHEWNFLLKNYYMWNMISFKGSVIEHNFKNQSSRNINVGSVKVWILYLKNSPQRIFCGNLSTHFVRFKVIPNIRLTGIFLIFIEFTILHYFYIKVNVYINVPVIVVFFGLWYYSI